ncbi:MAG: murein L,D-transpeptidase, partial [Pseudomonas sp.]
MFKKHACYLSLCLLVAPLVAMPDELPVEPPNPVQLALGQLSSVCPDLATQLDTPAELRLQAFYQQQGNAALWSVDDRRTALQGQLLLLADDGLDPAHYRLPDVATTSNVLCT